MAPAAVLTAKSRAGGALSDGITVTFNAKMNLSVSLDVTFIGVDCRPAAFANSHVIDAKAATT